MNKTFLNLVSLLALLFSACSQIPGLTPTPGTGPTVNPDDQFQTAVAQTLTARATLPSASETATTTLSSPVVSATDTATAVAPSITDTPTLVIDLSATSVTVTANIATATGLPAGGSSTATLPPGVTPIWTLAVRTYGTLPPEVPFSNITLVNKANTEAYISLQVTMPDGKYSILEYPVEGRVTIKAPVGSYLYVAWVGGRKMVGEFRLRNDNDLTITLQRDRVVIH